MRSILILLLLGLALSKPNYKQCDSRWANDKLGSSSTICKVGCLMSSVADYLESYTPGTLNAWLMSHGGYSGNLFIWGSVKPLGLDFVGFEANHDKQAAHIKAGRAVILNVNNGGHWVLGTGVSGSNFLVNDPGYSRTSYAFSEVKDSGVLKWKGTLVEPELLDTIRAGDFTDLSEIEAALVSE